MAPALQLPVEFVEHEVTEQRRKWSPLRSPTRSSDSPMSAGDGDGAVDNPALSSNIL
jgi:hypothetical protein